MKNIQLISYMIVHDLGKIKYNKIMKKANLVRNHVLKLCKNILELLILANKQNRYNTPKKQYIL